MRKLNRQKPFGEVTGVAGHRYEQNGLLFDGKGICTTEVEEVEVEVEEVEEIEVDDGRKFWADE